MKKLLLTLLMGLFLSPLQIFADHYPYEELYPDPQPPLRSPVVSQVAFDLDYYTGDMAVYAINDITGLNITITKNGVTYLNTTVALNAGQSYTDSLAGYAEGTYILTLSTADGVIAQYQITVVAD